MAVLGIAGGLISFLMLRTKDLHSTALSTPEDHAFTFIGLIACDIGL